MSEEEQNRYTKNRNLWRKSTTYGRYKPKIVSFVDGVTQENYDLNLNKVIRTRNPYQINPGPEEIPEIPFGEYEEGFVYFDNENIVTLAFMQPFSGTPVIVFDLGIGSDGYVNVANAINSPSGSHVFTSADFSGSVRYRAIYSSTYPCYVSSSFSASFLATAGTMYETGITSFSNTFQTNTYTPAGEVRASATKSEMTSEIRNNVGIANLYAVNNWGNGSITVNVSAPVGENEGINYLVVL